MAYLLSRMVHPKFPECVGMFRAVDPMICAYAHIGMVERVALALLHEPSPPEPRVVVRELLSIAFEGLRKR